MLLVVIFIIIIIFFLLLTYGNKTNLENQTKKTYYTPEEIDSKAGRKRESSISQYYSFTNRLIDVNKQFKKNMRADGILYTELDIDLHEFPSIVAALLKSKKHEWVVFGFEKKKKVYAMWVNKGIDNESVIAFLPPEEILALALENNYQSVLRFHNHPNPRPDIYDCSNPSPADIISAQEYGQVLKQNNVNYIDFVCERGYHFEFKRYVSESFSNIKYKREAVLDELKSRAESAYENFNFQEALNLYMSISEYKKEENLQDKVDKLKQELVIAEKIKNQKYNLNSLARYNFFYPFISSNRIKEVLDGFIDTIEEIQYDKNLSTMSSLENSLKCSEDYKIIKQYLECKKRFKISEKKEIVELVGKILHKDLFKKI